ncbi:putative nuclease HARBI1 [Episyrphus balteatus]|uniref:putative nuclease HARBI1 n=1 Tax=Episyrphus balteatus TaxID=286459 RepID=UPI002486CA6C|nr:putative nuclease HARBI1 [Episyrphus balteatus]
MPAVVGCIDCTLIKIDAPNNHEDRFIDRHGNHSINCMLVCGPDLRFYYCSAKWPGKVHDARVLRNSILYEKMENGWRPHPRSVLLGDSGYPLKEWLITPKCNNLEDPAVRNFNRAHKRTRCLVENSIGILKEKFPCLNHLRVQPIYACNIIKTCVSICNLTTNTHELLNQPSSDQNFNEGDPTNEMLIQPSTSGIIRQQELVNSFR